MIYAEVACLSDGRLDEWQSLLSRFVGEEFADAPRLCLPNDSNDSARDAQKREACCRPHCLTFGMLWTTLLNLE